MPDPIIALLLKVLVHRAMWFQVPKSWHQFLLHWIGWGSVSKITFLTIWEIVIWSDCYIRSCWVRFLTHFDMCWHTFVMSIRLYIICWYIVTLSATLLVCVVMCLQFLTLSLTFWDAAVFGFGLFWHAGGVDTFWHALQRWRGVAFDPLRYGMYAKACTNYYEMHTNAHSNCNLIHINAYVIATAI